MKRSDAPALRGWRVERVSGATRELVAGGEIPARQDIDDTAIAIATKVGQTVKRGMPTAQALGWIDLTSATGRRHEHRHEVGFEWDEMRTAIYDLLYESGDTVLLHRGQCLHITVDPAPETEFSMSAEPAAAPTEPVRVLVSLKVPADGLSLQGPALHEVWLPGFMCGHVGAHGARWRRYSPRTGRMTGEYYNTPDEAAKALAARWGDNENATIEIVEHAPAREEQP